MKTHFELSDSEFEKRFKDGSLTPTLFTHEAHLRLAFIHISKYGLKTACNTISNQISKYVIQLDKADKFNKTLTIAGVKIVNHFMIKSKSNTFQEFITKFPRLKNNFKQLLDTHYGFDIVNSEKAKISYLEPDILPF